MTPARAPMAADAVAAMLAQSRKVQLATINPDGTPHLVTMFYVLHEGRIAFWTYRAAQKTRNLARDPRLTCLVEDGDDYFELRGVQLSGIARRIDEPAAVARIGRLIAARLTGVPVDTLGDYVTRAAAKRVAFLVEPTKVTTWDHRRLLT